MNTHANPLFFRLLLPTPQQVEPLLGVELRRPRFILVGFELLVGGRSRRNAVGRRVESRDPHDAVQDELAETVVGPVPVPVPAREAESAAAIGPLAQTQATCSGMPRLARTTGLPLWCPSGRSRVLSGGTAVRIGVTPSMFSRNLM